MHRPRSSSGNAYLNALRPKLIYSRRGLRRDKTLRKKRERGEDERGL
jgi:hypothetical protein